MAHRARKRFGQNFLRDQSVIDSIVRAIRPGPEDHLVEIGPGQGALTGALLERCGRLDIVELDRDLVQVLSRKFAAALDGGSMRLFSSDALKFDFTSLPEPGESGGLRVVGNLPYNISTPLIFHLLDCLDVIADMHFMLQKEVVERLAARPGGRDYGRLSVMVQYRCRVEPLFVVPPEAFAPAPKVESAVFRMTPWEQPPVRVSDERRFAEVVTRAFAQRRKTLRNNLRDLLSEEQIRAAGADPGQRAEELDLETFARLSEQG